MNPPFFWPKIIMGTDLYDETKTVHVYSRGHDVPSQVFLLPHYIYTIKGTGRVFVFV